MKNAILATRNKTVAKRLIKQAKRVKKHYGMPLSEAIEFTMKRPAIWEGYEHLI